MNILPFASFSVGISTSSQVTETTILTIVKKKPLPIYPDAYASINYKKIDDMCFFKEMDGVRGWEIVNTKLKLN